MTESKHLRICGMENPLGLEETPSLSWRLESDGRNVMQKSYRIQVVTGGNQVYDSGVVESGQTVHIPVPVCLAPFTAYTLRLHVTCRGEYDGQIREETARTETSFEAGRMDTPWNAQWITGGAEIDRDDETPPYLFQREFARPLRSARLFASALGCYDVQINGKPVSEEYFAPGYTQYDKRVLYREYDVTEFLRQGGNRIRAEVAGGWYAGRLGLCMHGNCFGSKRALLLELRITWADGTETVLGTGPDWRITADGPRRFAEFFDGEIYDARWESETDWIWEPAAVYAGTVPPLEPHDGVPVRRHEKVPPVQVREAPNGAALCDFGRNFAGIVELSNIEGKAGQNIVIRHGELLDSEGNLYTENLRTAKQQLRYTCKDGRQSYAPKFCYMGFRYAEITGLTAEQAAESVAAWEVYSDIPVTGEFSCSDPRVNRLQKNIQTSQKANLVDIPTDCPQRDERCGWTGDIAMFGPTAAFNMDISRFMHKWLRDVRLAQYPDGVIPFIVPTNGIKSIRNDGPYGYLMKQGAAAWGDVITLLPWTLYRTYGDRNVLKENYPAMKAWVEYQRRRSRHLSAGDGAYLWDSGFQFGDWLAPGEDLGKNIRKGKWIATAFFARSAWI